MNNDEISKSFAKFKIKVQWGDMDAAQHVNNTVYLRWIESARLEMIAKLNLGNLDFKGIGPILSWVDCKYVFPITYPDSIIATYGIAKIKSDRIECVGKIYSERHGRLAVISKSTLMAYDFTTKSKSSIPKKWIDELTKFYGRTILDK